MPFKFKVKAECKRCGEVREVDGQAGEYLWALWSGEKNRLIYLCGKCEDIEDEIFESQCHVVKGR
jgi:hypothetical protein